MLWVKALHIIAIVCWFAALFYLPRLFVYHASVKDQISDTRFKLMERRLYMGIAVPAMLVTLITGVLLLSVSFKGYLAAPWMDIKLFLVVLVIGYHHICGYYMKQFEKNKNKKSAVFFRFFNEVPTLLLISIIILAIVRPF